MPDPKSPSFKRIDLLSTLRELPDPRVERTRLHKFEDILLISICALLCGAESFEDMELFGDTKEPWLRTFHLLKADTRKAKRSINGRIKAAGWDHNYLLHLLALNPGLDA